MMIKNYYLSSFFWSTLQKLLSAILGFISVPLLLGYYGKADYGLLAIATSCNGYMHLLDLGMNIGSIKFYAQWREEGKDDLINKVSRTNISWQCPKYCVNEKTGFRYNLLYLDSVFKYKNKLVHNQTPIVNWLCPFLLNFH